ncbi:MAG: KTSC domain-containing protein [Thermoflexales bacterium]|nr:KTSC domain-containing protein [Thermoflexales bacterium]
MKRVEVASSVIRAAGYDPHTKTLEVELLDGHVYVYRGVPAVVYRDLMNAASVGQYFAHFIKTTYPCTRVE